MGLLRPIYLVFCFLCRGQLLIYIRTVQVNQSQNIKLYMR